MKLTTHIHLVLKLRMRGAIPLLPLYIFMAWCLVKFRIPLHGVTVKHRDNFADTKYVDIFNLGMRLSFKIHVSIVIFNEMLEKCFFYGV
jgi:hypothetical protein